MCWGLRAIRSLADSCCDYVAVFLCAPAGYQKRFNNRQFMLLCQCGFGAIWLFIYLIGIKYYTRPIVVVPAIMVGQFLFGLISSPCNIILNEMMAEATDYSEWRTGKRNEGVGFSMKNYNAKNW